MSGWRTLAILVLAVGTLACPVVAAQTTAETPGATATNASGNETAGFGVEFSAFMQSTAGESEDAVADGMWESEFEAEGGNRTEAVESRTDSLERRLDELRNESQRLDERHENGSVAYVARSSRLAARVAALERALNRTERHARAAGVNTTRIESLQASAATLRERTAPSSADGVSTPGGARPAPDASEPARAPPDDDPENASRARDGPADGTDAPGSVAGASGEGSGATGQQDDRSDATGQQDDRSGATGQQNDRANGNAAAR